MTSILRVRLRHRIDVVYTDIKKLPRIGKDDFSWIKEFCMRCGRCIREYLVRAIYENPSLLKGNM